MNASFEIDVYRFLCLKGFYEFLLLHPLNCLVGGSDSPWEEMEAWEKLKCNLPRVRQLGQHATFPNTVTCLQSPVPITKPFT
jgi:hypothetical protein